MKQVHLTGNRHSERGGAGVKFLSVALVIFLIGHAGYNYIPTAYQAASFKQDMDTAVIQGIALPKTYGKPGAIILGKLTKSAQTNQLPDEVFIDVQEKNKTITARVYYEKQVPLLPFGMYDYTYVFDYTASPSGFLTEGN
jgi:hypothetical protein